MAENDPIPEDKRDVGQSDDEAHDLNTEFLDDTSDSHAVQFGWWDAMKNRGPGPRRYEEATEEPHYYYLGYSVGWMVKLAVLAGVGWIIFGVPFR